jgi:hypothetical protein
MAASHPARQAVRASVERVTNWLLLNPLAIGKNQRCERAWIDRKPALLLTREAAKEDRIVDCTLDIRGLGARSR